MLDIQHDAYVHVVATTHVHLDHHNCLETIIIRGEPEQIKRLRLEIGGLRGVRFSALTRASRIAL
jgi:CopG family nickel-responsive transcriptional regulator